MILFLIFHEYISNFSVGQKTLVEWTWKFVKKS